MESHSHGPLPTPAAAPDAPDEAHPPRPGLREARAHSSPDAGRGTDGAADGHARSVLLVSYEYPPLGGGGGVIVRDLCEELARSIDVTVLTSGRPGLPPCERTGRLRVVRVPVLRRTARATASLPSMLSFLPSSLRVGRALLREQHFDVVHSAFAVPSGPSGVLLARSQRIPHVLSLLGGDVYDPSKRLSPHRTPLLKQTVRWVIGRSDRVVACSRDIAERARRTYLDRPIGCVPLAARLADVAPCPREELGAGIADGDAVLVTVGRLVTRKGLAQLLEVLARLPERVRLVVVGEGPERQALEDRARELGVTGRVCFTGFVEESRKRQILAASTLYVSTSQHEGFGIVFLEAMGAGLPVVCFDCGGPSDFVSDAVGRVVPLGQTQQLGAAIEALLADAPQRRRLGAAARALASEYTVEAYAARYRAIYAEALRRSRGS